MKKCIGVVALMVGMAWPSYGLDLGEQITSTLIGHVQVATQFGFDDESRIALLDSVIQIGSHNGSSILDLQVGYAGETSSSDDGFLAGGFLRLDTLISDHIGLPSHWEFLRALEHGPSYFYSFDEKEWYGSYQVGLAFGLNPVE